MRVLRALERIPWQVSGAIGWSSLAIVGTLAETIDRESPLNAAAHEKRASLSSGLVLSATALQSLGQQGYVVIDDALTPPALNVARCECSKLREDDAFKVTDQHGGTRSDAVVWVTEGADRSSSWWSRPDPTPGLSVILRGLRGLAAQLDGATGWQGFAQEEEGLMGRIVDLGVPPSAQLACYPRSTASTLDSVRAETGGARYVAHRDGLAFGRAILSPFSIEPWKGLLFALLEPALCMREMTCIIYLSEAADWTCEPTSPGVSTTQSPGRDAPRLLDDTQSSRDGALLLYLGAKTSDTMGATAQSIVEVMPVGGRLVIFDSRSVLHEVRPHTRSDIDRVAMTLWIGGAHDVRGLLRHLQAWWFAAACASPV